MKFFWYGLFFIFLAGSIVPKNYYNNKQENWEYIPVSSFSKKLRGYNLPFKQAIGDFFYLQAILSIGETYKTRQDWINKVQDRLIAAMGFDNQLIQAAFLGGVVLNYTPQELDDGIEFIKQAVYLCGGHWQFFYWIGFNYYQKGEYIKAAKYYQLSANFEGAPSFLITNQPMLYYKAGQVELGFRYLNSLKDSLEGWDKIKGLDIKIDWLKKIVYLEQAIKKFYEQFSSYPDNLHDLVNKGIISQIPDDPFGKGFYWDKKELRVKSKFAIEKDNEN